MHEILSEAVEERGLQLLLGAIMRISLGAFHLDQAFIYRYISSTRPHTSILNTQSVT